MRSVNKVILVGHVGNDPEFRTTIGGTPVASFSLATNKRWNDANDNAQEKTEWHRCATFGPVAEIADKWVRKGDPLYIEGRIEYQQWTDKEGTVRYSTEINVRELVMLGTARGARAESGDESHGNDSGSERSASGDDAPARSSQRGGARERTRARGAGRGSGARKR